MARAMAGVRLRQAVVVTSDLPATITSLENAVGLRDPYLDPGVKEFGLENRVFAAGDCFVEVLTPIREGTAGGRHIERHGGDAGYMAIFQFDDLETARKRVADLDIRVVWQADLGDISGTHLHPKDVPGAIVSLDWADPPESWHWAGPKWRGGAPDDREAGGISALTIAASDPPALAARWADVLGLDAVPDAEGGGVRIELPDAAQQLLFVQADRGQQDAIVGIGLSLPAREVTADISGVRFTVTPA